MATNFRLKFRRGFASGVAGEPELPPDYDIWYVAPGDLSGDGSVEDPFDFRDGITKADYPAGDHLQIAAGDYSFYGGIANTIPFIDCPGVGKLSGGMFIGSAGNVWNGLEVWNSLFTDRESAQETSAPTDLNNGDRPSSIRSDGELNTFIDFIIHDCQNGGYVANTGSGTVFDGCIIYHCGWLGPDRGHGHGMYVHGNSGEHSIIVRNCIVFDNFGLGLQEYSGYPNNNVHYVNNIVFNAGSLAGTPDDNMLSESTIGLVWTGNATYGGGAYANRPTYGGSLTGGVIEDNYCPDGIVFDAPIGDSTFTGNVTAPEASNYVRVIGVRGRAHVAVYNWEVLDTVTIDLSTVVGMGVGDEVTVANVQDLFVDIVNRTLDANKRIAVDMRAASHTIATPLGWSPPAKTFPEFGCFVIRKV